MPRKNRDIIDDLWEDDDFDEDDEPESECVTCSICGDMAFVNDDWTYTCASCGCDTEEDELEDEFGDYA